MTAPMQTNSQPNHRWDINSIANITDETPTTSWTAHCSVQCVNQLPKRGFFPRDAEPLA